MKVKPIRRLKWQFAKLLESPRLDAFEIFDALSTAGIVAAIAFDAGGRPSHYREVLDEKLHKSAFHAAVLVALTAYCRKLGLEYATAKDPTRALERPEDYYDPNEFGA